MVLERLIEAKAAVDAKDEDGRGLGRRILGRGNPPEAMGSLRDEVDEMLIRFMVQVLGGLLIFCWKLSAKTFAYPTPIPLEYQVG